MAYLVGKTSIDIIDEDAIDIRKKLPIGIYKLQVAQMRGFFLEKTEYKTEHGKIYGKAGSIASHIVDAYNRSSDNLGVLLSGGKGLGKSLTSRLVVEKLAKDHPIIIIDQFINGMFDFLSGISDAVYLFDEFEKIMAGNIDGSDNNTKATSKQDAMLSFLDGTAVGSHNLYLLTCNETRSLNDCLMSRPGRIRYHYRYESCDAETIKKYCADNLDRKELEKEIVEGLLATRYVSIDIVKALVDEVNAFDVSVEEALNYLNIESERISIMAKITWRIGDTEKTYTEYPGTFIPGSSSFDIYLESDEVEDKNKMEFCANLHIDMSGKTIPMYGAVDVTDSTYMEYHYGDEEPEIVKVELSDRENAKYDNYKKINHVDGLDF